MLVFIFVFFFSSSVPSTLDNFCNDIRRVTLSSKNHLVYTLIVMLRHLTDALKLWLKDVHA